MLDVLIKNARLVDGTGAPWFCGNIAVLGERIAALGQVDEPARRVIDAAGRVVAPGFIDAHSHSDDALFKNPQAESKVRQGVTTEVIGQCGSSAAPRTPSPDHTEPFASFAEYLDLLEARGIGVNVVPLVGHGNIRAVVMGFADRAATAEELEQMCRLTGAALQAGAHGLTTGLIYPPSSYGSHAEIIALAKVVASYGGLYASHMRNEREGLLASVAETIDVGRQAKLPVHISHHKVCGEQNFGLVKESLALVDAMRQTGVDVTLDQYPYTATSTGLKVVVPQWAHAGGTTAMGERVVDPSTRARIVGEILAGREQWDSILVSSCHKEQNKQFEGRTLAEISRLVGKEPIEACLDLLLDENFDVGMVRFAMCEADVEYVLQHPLVMIGSDATLRATYGPLSTGKPHPRAYGTFPRVLGTYVRERGVLRLEEAVRKMTSFPAQRFQLYDRGLLRPGAYADLVMFDPETVADLATYSEPHVYPRGIDMVLVNGAVVVENGAHSGTLPGKVLRRGRRGL
ncbi:MAG: D-aminoacylase [Firmicutes bacterium]|nr:D-aminoacylase [Bacillota bacterium]